MFQAHVGNIGRIGDFDDSAEAIAAVIRTIRNSARADDYGFVLDDAGEVVWEHGEPDNA